MAGISGDVTKTWDPTGGPDGQGAWVTVGGSTQNFTIPGSGQPTAVQYNPAIDRKYPGADPRQRVPGAWGGYGDFVDPLGDPIAGTSGMAVDVSRYRGMAERPAYAAGPWVGSLDINQTRGLSMGALGALRNRAEGGITAAQDLAARQTRGAVSGIRSGAASIKGGAMARAAAARGAQAMGARLSALGMQDAAALRASEMADAANQYFVASSAQRGQDLNVATTQAGLNMAQKAENDAREQFYEGLGFDTKMANLNSQLNRSEAEASAASAQAANAVARDTAARNAYTTGAGVVLGGLTGILGAARTAAGSEKKPPDPYSDVRTKANVHQVGDPMADANRSMAPSWYEYKPEFTPNTQRQGELNVGPMANAMARDPVARTAIGADPDTGLLSIDPSKALKLTMGGLASLQRQVDRLKGARQ